VTVFDEALRADAIRAARDLRRCGVATDLYLGEGKLKNQLKHAHAMGYPWVVFVGPDEAAAGQIKLKHMASGDAMACGATEAAERIAGEGSP
jgi:histidyl-tRNA synthetase